MTMDFESAKKKALAFRDERNWSQFHNPKDLAISLSLEASELLECFDVAKKRPQMEEELADVVIYAILLADRIGADIPEIVGKKIDKNARKYPVDKARGNARKYDEL